MSVNCDQKEVPTFKTCVEFHKTVLRVRVLLFIAYFTCGSHSMLDALEQFSKHSFEQVL